jgi:hypothetical protein
MAFRICQSESPTFQKGEANSDDALPQIGTTDIVACNGIIHTLDNVMLYQEISVNMTESPSSTPEESTDSTSSPTTSPISTEEPECLSIGTIISLDVNRLIGGGVVLLSSSICVNESHFLLTVLALVRILIVAVFSRYCMLYTRLFYPLFVNSRCWFGGRLIRGDVDCLCSQQ